MITFEEVIAIINHNPHATYVACVNGEFVTLTGTTMRGFLMSTDSITYFRLWN